MVGLADLDAKEIAPLVQLRMRFRTTTPTPGSNEANTSIIASSVVRKQPHHTLPQDKRDDLLHCYQQGEPVGELCKRFGISRNYLNQTRKAAGVDVHQRGLTDNQLAQAIHHYADGESLATVARRFGVSPSTVGRALRAQGTHLRSRPGR